MVIEFYSWAPSYTLHWSNGTEAPGLVRYVKHAGSQLGCHYRCQAGQITETYRCDTLEHEYNSTIDTLNHLSDALRDLHVETAVSVLRAYLDLIWSLKLKNCRVLRARCRISCWSRYSSRPIWHKRRCCGGLHDRRPIKKKPIYSWFSYSNILYFLLLLGNMSLYTFFGCLLLAYGPILSIFFLYIAPNAQYVLLMVSRFETIPDCMSTLD